MSKFGQQLRYFRERASDPDLGKDRLTQARLGELIGHTLGLAEAISFQTISRWENGRPTIAADDRPLQLALVQVLHHTRGLASPQDADDLLTAGHFCGLRPEEAQAIFGHQASGRLAQEPPVAGAAPAAAHGAETPAHRPDWRERLSKRWTDWTAPTRGGSEPPPDGPTLILRSLGAFQPKLPMVIWALLWGALLWVTWQMLFPLMRWPFATPIALAQAAERFAVGMVAIPLGMAALAQTWREAAWRERPGAGPISIGLSALLGAWVGFQVGGMLVFGLALIGYHFDLPRAGSPIELVGAVIPIGLGYAAARRIPHDTWKAFGRLDLRDSAIFFVLVGLGPAWAAFFWYTHDALLNRFVGALILWVSLLGAAGLAYWQKRRTGSTVLPVHVWIAIFGAALVAGLWQEGEAPLRVIYLAGLVSVLACASAWGRLTATLPGALGLLVALGLVAIAGRLLPWAGGLVALGLFGLWAWRGRRWISLPLGVWLTAGAAGLCEYGVRQPALTATQAGVVFIGLAGLFLAYEFWRARRGARSGVQS